MWGRAVRFLRVTIADLAPVFWADHSPRCTAILVNRKENLWVCKVRFKEQCKLGIAMVLRGSHVCCGTHRSQKQHATHIWSRLLCPFVPRSKLCLSQHSQNSAKLWLTRLFTKEMCEIPQVGIYHIGVLESQCDCPLFEAEPPHDSMRSGSLNTESGDDIYLQWFWEVIRVPPCLHRRVVWNFLPLLPVLFLWHNFVISSTFGEKLEAVTSKCRMLKNISQ